MRKRDARGGEESRADRNLEETILAYLREHPNAMDTLEGIAEWWVLQQLAQQEVPRLARVLQRLTTRGLLERVGTGPSWLYRARARGAGTGEATRRKP